MRYTAESYDMLGSNFLTPLSDWWKSTNLNPVVSLTKIGNWIDQEGVKLDKGKTEVLKDVFSLAQNAKVSYGPEGLSVSTGTGTLPNGYTNITGQATPTTTPTTTKSNTPLIVGGISIAAIIAALTMR
jgi:hypothetical protein